MFVYILHSPNAPGLYTGITRDPVMRLARHNDGTGAKYTRGRGPWTIVYLEPARDRNSAARREREIKTWSRAAKLALIRHFNSTLAIECVQRCTGKMEFVTEANGRQVWCCRTCNTPVTVRK